MKRIAFTIMIALAMGGLAFSISGQTIDGIFEVRETENGKVIVVDDGFTLYVSSKDGSNKSNCIDECVDSWAPYFAFKDESGDGPYTIIERDDGDRQWAYKAQPLYTFTGDERPGDMTGDGKDGIWKALRP